jgi:hypothetical protein
MSGRLERTEMRNVTAAVVRIEKGTESMTARPNIRIFFIESSTDQAPRLWILPTELYGVRSEFDTEF